MQRIQLKATRTTQALVALALVSAFLGVGAAAAQAEPFHLEFDHGLTDMGNQKKVVAINPGTPVTMDGEISGTSFTIPQAGVNWPPQALTKPIPSTSYTEVNGPLTGSFDAATGELTMQGSFTFATESALTGKCTIGPTDLSFSTAGTTPYAGAPYAHGLANWGAIVASWSSLPDPVGRSNCDLVKKVTAAPGGLWISTGVPSEERICVVSSADCGEWPPPRAVLRLALPAGRSVIGGKWAKLKVEVSNKGTAAASAVKVCATVPPPLKAPACVRVPSLAIGAGATRTFSIKTPAVARARSFGLKFTASAAGYASSAGKKMKLRVKPQRASARTSSS